MLAMKAVLLDVDGTLLQSNVAHARSWADAFAERGYDIPTTRIVPLIGMGGDKLLDALAPGMGPADGGAGEAIAMRRSEIFRSRYLAGCRPTNGARALLLYLRDCGMRLVVASSAGGEELSGLLGAAQVADLIENAATTDDARHSKPDPDIVRAALRKAAVSPSDAIMLGDTPYDVAAARRAGVRVVAVRCGGWSEPHVRADAICNDPDEICRFLQAPSGHASLKWLFGATALHGSVQTS